MGTRDGNDFEEIPCELCGSNDYRLVFRLKDYRRGSSEIFQLVSCQKCQLVFLNPRPTREKIGSYYTKEDWFRADEKVSLESAQVHKRPWREVQASRCQPFLVYKQRGRILDVGCGEGFFLKFLSEKGWDCYGVEISPMAVQYALGFGLKVEQGGIEEVSFPEDSFDVITLFANIEHLYHPLAVLKKVSYFLKEDGILYLGGIPNFDSFERRLFNERWMALNVPQHLYHFTPKTMRHLLEEANYQPIGMGFKSTEGRMALGYTESLRYFLSDFGMYPKRKIMGLAEPFKSHDVSRGKPLTFLLEFLHVIETTFFMGVEKLTDGIGKGSFFWILAQKK